jgi:hypothetical protein
MPGTHTQECIYNRYYTHIISEVYNTFYNALGDYLVHLYTKSFKQNTPCKLY